MPSYHFDVGNSDEGPIGYCARVTAESKEEAIEKLRAQLDHIGGAREIFRDWDDIEYLEVYFNSELVTVDDIDEVNEDESDDEED